MSETKFEWAKGIEDSWEHKFGKVMVGLSVYVGIPVIIICFIIWVIGIFSLPIPPIK